MGFCSAKNFRNRVGLKLFLHCRITRKESRSVRVSEWIPDVVFPMLPKLVVVVHKTSNFLKQFPCARNQKFLDSALGNVRGTKADILLAIIDPVDVGIPLSAQNQVLLVVVWGDSMNELADATMPRIVGVHSIFLFCGLYGVLDNPSRQSALSNLRDEMPM